MNALTQAEHSRIIWLNLKVRKKIIVENFRARDYACFFLKENIFKKKKTHTREELGNLEEETEEEEFA